MIFHICPVTDWIDAMKAGVYAPQGLDTEGFIHCSTIDQLVQSANLHFCNHNELVVLCIKKDKLDPPVKYEFSTTRKESFPHIYGPINLSAVVNVIDMEKGRNDKFELPLELTYMK